MKRSRPGFRNAANCPLGILLAGGANLTNANLYQATLFNVNFCGACLANASITHTTFYNVNFTNANLTNANLYRTVLAGACVVGAVFVDCKWDAAVISGVDLRTLSEFNVGEHVNPSSVGVDTLYLTAGGAPLSEMPEPYRGFFLACGVNPELFEAKQVGALDMLRQVTGELAGKQQSGILGASGPAGSLPPPYEG